jgi:hypothetical protein
MTLISRSACCHGRSSHSQICRRCRISAQRRAPRKFQVEHSCLPLSGRLAGGNGSRCNQQALMRAHGLRRVKKYPPVSQCLSHEQGFFLRSAHPITFVSNYLRALRFPFPFLCSLSISRTAQGEASPYIVPRFRELRIAQSLSPFFYCLSLQSLSSTRAAEAGIMSTIAGSALLRRLHKTLQARSLRETLAQAIRRASADARAVAHT